MENWYYCLAGIAYALFLVQFVLSLIGADTELDVDFDGEVDFETSDLVSFKGCIHFLMGFAGYISLRHWRELDVTWKDYVMALLIGIAFVIILFYVYKLVMNLRYEPKQPESLDGSTGVVTYVYKDKVYVSVIVNGITQEVLARKREDQFVAPGSSVTLHLTSGIYYI